MRCTECAPENPGADRRYYAGASVTYATCDIAQRGLVTLSGPIGAIAWVGTLPPVLWVKRSVRAVNRAIVRDRNRALVHGVVHGPGTGGSAARPDNTLGVPGCSLAVLLLQEP